MTDRTAKGGPAIATFPEARKLVVDALRASAVPSLDDPGVGGQLNDPATDYYFADLEADSLVLTEICLFVEAKTGLALSTGELRANRSINGLARYLVGRLANATE
jgi:acyl carrier protein